MFEIFIIIAEIIGLFIIFGIISMTENGIIQIIAIPFFAYLMMDIAPLIGMDYTLLLFLIIAFIFRIMEDNVILRIIEIVIIIYFIHLMIGGAMDLIKA